MPRLLARSFIISTKRLSVPATYSAMATDASLAEATEMHLIIVSTLWVSPASRNTWEPPMDEAYSEVVTVSSRWIFPWEMASKISNSVITFVTLAGGSCSWAFFSSTTVPVDASIRIAEGAEIPSVSAGVSSAQADITGNCSARIRTTRRDRNFFIVSHPCVIRLL